MTQLGHDRSTADAARDERYLIAALPEAGTGGGMVFACPHLWTGRLVVPRFFDILGIMADEDSLLHFLASARMAACVWSDEAVQLFFFPDRVDGTMSALPLPNPARQLSIALSLSGRRAAAFRRTIVDLRDGELRTGVFALRPSELRVDDRGFQAVAAVARPLDEAVVEASSTPAEMRRPATPQTATVQPSAVVASPAGGVGDLQLAVLETLGMASAAEEQAADHRVLPLREAAPVNGHVRAA